MIQVQLLLGERLKLRALEPQDVETLYKWENDTAIWVASHTQVPFSRFILEQYIAQSHLDLHTNKQLRLMITTKEGQDVGAIDLFDFDPQHQRAGIGILVAEKQDRGKGYATEAVKRLLGFAFHDLKLHRVEAGCDVDNLASARVLEKAGLQREGRKRKVLPIRGDWKDNFIYGILEEDFL